MGRKKGRREGQNEGKMEEEKVGGRQARVKRRILLKKKNTAKEKHTGDVEGTAIWIGFISLLISLGSQMLRSLPHGLQFQKAHSQYW